MSDHARYTALSRYFRVLREQRFVIALIALVTAGTALGLSILQTTKYESTASVSFQDQAADTDLLGAPVGAQLLPIQLAARSAETIKSDRIVLAVARRLGRRSLKELRDASLTATVDLASNLVRVTVTGEDPKTAATIANAFAVEGTRISNADARARYSAAADDLRRQIRGLRKSQGRERALYTMQLTRLQSLAAFTRPAEIAEFARPAEDPESPTPVKNTLFGMLAGVLLGVLAAFLRNVLDRRPRSLAEVRAVLHMPLLGYVRKQALGRKLTDHASGSSGGADLEASRIIRRNLEFLDVGAEVEVVAVTSALSEEGKSTVAASLALASAARGKRTLLLECDLRRPSLPERLGGRRVPGLTDHLNGDAALDDVLQVLRFDDVPTPGANGSDPGPSEFTVVMAGAPAPHPAALFGSQRFETLLSELRGAYDAVILDTAPLLPVADTLEIVPLTDGVILCVRVNQTTRDQAAAAHSALDRFPPRPTGLVITGTRSRDEGAYGADGSTYGYYTRPRERTPASTSP